MRKIYFGLLMILLSIIFFNIGKYDQAREEAYFISPEAIDRLIDKTPHVGPSSQIAEDMYKNCYINTYLADTAIKNQKYNNAAYFLRRTLELRRLTPKYWKFHSKYPILSDDINTIIDPIEGRCTDNTKIIESYLLIIYTYLETNQFDMAYSALSNCIEYENKNPIENGLESGYESCINERENILWIMISADQCGFLNILHSRTVPIEDKKKLIEKLYNMIDDDQNEKRNNK